MDVTPLIPTIPPHDSWTETLPTMTRRRPADRLEADVIRSRTDIRIQKLMKLQPLERSYSVAQFLTGIHISRLKDGFISGDVEVGMFTAVACYWMCKVEGYSYWSAGLVMDMHHTTVMAGCKRLIMKAPELLPAIETIKNQIRTAERKSLCLA